ncbi:endonuclease/exonuclease/phosphatase family protein [Rossellomorea vietnamensis]|uniref:endonuclease/exonuclease/phosphatase family protein n=1 Tax=Rossellomorea vietnamensis TaxID=218284 RepID=UPI001CCEA89A|nr:endonuclease/exonuclease/phosphatase family protein [Rossellomorea vietnamensis]MCA0149954.1 endonuclease/exonuclease/phosphatase family protein [Rossellomorea vietnamensis]
MKLLTLNCHSWQEDNQLDKISILADDIAEESYDVIALQEVSQLIESEIVHGLVKKDNFALVLLGELDKRGVTDYTLVWDFAHIGYDVYEEGVAILTKHPIVEEHRFFVSKSHDQSYWKTRKIVGATISYHDKPLTFYSCHLGWWTDEEEPFKYQVDSLMEQVTPESPFFLMGDFNNNALVRDEGYDYLLSKGLTDTFGEALERDSGITVRGNIAGWDENTVDLRLDLILSSTKIDVTSSEVIFNDGNKPVVSDHFGVEVVLAESN